MKSFNWSFFIPSPGRPPPSLPSYVSAYLDMLQERLFPQLLGGKPVNFLWQNMMKPLTIVVFLYDSGWTSKSDRSIGRNGRDNRGFFFVHLHVHLT